MLLKSLLAASKILFETFARPKDLDAQCRGVVVFLSYSKALDLWLGSVGAGCRALHLSAPRGMCGKRGRLNYHLSGCTIYINCRIADIGLNHSESIGFWSAC